MQHVADRLVGGDAAGDDQRGRRAVARAEQPQAGAQPVGDDVDHRLLERGAEIGDVLVDKRRDRFGFEPQRGLQARRTRSRLPCGRCIGRGSAKRVGIAARGLLLDLRPAGIAQAQQLRGLVEGLADGVVDASCRAARNRRRRAPRGSGCGRRRRGTGNRETASPSVSRAVSAWASRWLTAISGLPSTSAMALAVVRPTMTPPIRPGPAAAATPSSVVEARCRPRSCACGDDAVERLDMGARGDLRHHAAEGGMLGRSGDSTTLDRMRPRPSSRALDHRGGGLVAGRLDAEDEHGRLVAFASRRPHARR